MNNIQKTQKILDELKTEWNKYPKEPYTNFDKIKDMDIDDMAEWLNTIAHSLCCIYINGEFVKPTKDNFLKWLEEEICQTHLMK